MSNLQQPNNALLALKATNVSSPSIIHRRSEQSITASEDYYSLNSSRSRSSIDPTQSHDNLATQQPHDSTAGTSALRGAGQRRQSLEAGTERGVVPAPMQHAHLREGGVRRKPVPSTVMERPESGVLASPTIPTRGTVIDQRSNFDPSPPTPGPHDEQYIRFALEQLTRDEEVRGSRLYDGLGSGKKGNFAYIAPGTPGETRAGQDATAYASASGAASDGSPGILNSRSGGLAYERDAQHAQTRFQRRQEEQTRLLPETPPPRNPRRESTPPFMARGLVDDDFMDPRRSQDNAQRHARLNPSVLQPVVADASHPLDFVPGILRPMQLGVFLLLVLAFTAGLLFCAIWSLLKTGLWDYGTFGDSRYFVFEYLPTILGMLLLMWTFEVQRAVTRIAPFVGLASDLPATRAKSLHLPLSHDGFLKPRLEYWRAKMWAVGVFQAVAWLQLFSIPLLASSFNVYFYGSPDTGRWRWIATQGAVWTVIALYLALAGGLITMLVWIHTTRRRHQTGLQWDPRSMADLLAIIAQSNALAGREHVEDDAIARLGHWNVSTRPAATLYTYGAANSEMRQYGVRDGQVHEMGHSRDGSGAESDAENEKRRSKEPILQRRLDRSTAADASVGSASISLPWFLRPIYTSLWAIAAVVLLLAFLIVSYLPSTRVSAGFEPDVPAPVTRMGFSSTNFLYSFLPALLGELCLLFWLECDGAHRRLAPFFALLEEDQHNTYDDEKRSADRPRLGATAERSLLISYSAQLPVIVTLAAIFNGNFRLALLTLISLVAAALPVLGGGFFWAQFIIDQQRVQITAHMPAYYALTTLVTLFALSWILLLPFSRVERRLAHSKSDESNRGRTFADFISLVRESKIIDDVAFHQSVSKVALVTRLIAPASAITRPAARLPAAESTTSIVDSIRRLANVPQRRPIEHNPDVSQRYAIGVFTGRNGRPSLGIDRVRS
ncbi:hypothetical protein B0A48_13110 [Cryoendolithus antarcticus]|uniref:Phosphoribosylaminoimidazole-succinocarboxamide synthase n=1 Tax=Cryoendolithus antarcticus TaxID=1507870 RepID=A0A1V8SNH2_9PEZI|nr:hypothetical protein B0A48_13110 [Cryoendolithus antarcticus]